MQKKQFTISVCDIESNYYNMGSSVKMFKSIQESGYMCSEIHSHIAVMNMSGNFMVYKIDEHGHPQVQYTLDVLYMKFQNFDNLAESLINKVL